jgi:hypothetical protein
VGSSVADVPVPVTIGTDEAQLWPGGSEMPLRLALLWARFAPRAKAWMPRVIGRRFGRHMRATVRTASGGTLAVDPDNLDIYVHVTRLGGVWDRQVHEACNTVARPGDVVYDIGANAGVVTIDLAAHLKGDVHIFAFEPIPSLARGVALSAVLSGYGDAITVYEAMLGEGARRDLLDFLASCAAYRFYYAGMDGLEPLVDPDAPFDLGHQNVLAIPPGRQIPRAGSGPPADLRRRRSRRGLIGRFGVVPVRTAGAILGRLGQRDRE